MGCWNESCGLTGLPVTNGLKSRYMVIRRVKRDKSDHAVYYPFDIFQPVSILATGEYDDYGGIEMKSTEEADFFASLTASGVGFHEAEMHGNIRVNGKEYRLPVDHYHWFARDDSFRMLNDLPNYRYSFKAKTLGASQIETLKKVVEEAEKAARQSAIYGFMLGAYEIGQVFGRLEMPQPPVYRHLLERLVESIKLYPKDEIEKLKLDEVEDKGDLDALLAKLPKPDLNHIPRFAQPILDLNLVLYGMMALRKQLAPTGGTGSQSWNDGAYEVYGEFVRETAKRWRREIEGGD